MRRPARTFTITCDHSETSQGTIMNHELGQALAFVHVYDRINELRRVAGETRMRRGTRRRKVRGHRRP
jgi:hypothetical protein